MPNFLHLTVPIEIRVRPASMSDTVALTFGMAGTVYLDRDTAFTLADQLRDALRELDARTQEDR